MKAIKKNDTADYAQQATVCVDIAQEALQYDIFEDKNVPSLRQ